MGRPSVRHGIVDLADVRMSCSLPARRRPRMRKQLPIEGAGPRLRILERFGKRWDLQPRSVRGSLKRVAATGRPPRWRLQPSLAKQPGNLPILLSSWPAPRHSGRRGPRQPLAGNAPRLWRHLRRRGCRRHGRGRRRKPSGVSTRFNVPRRIFGRKALSAWRAGQGRARSVPRRSASRTARAPPFRAHSRKRPRLRAHGDSPARSVAVACPSASAPRRMARGTGV